MSKTLFLNNTFSYEEIKTALFQLHPNKSPGPDGFQVSFLQKHWFFLGHDLWQAIEGAKNFGNILTKINHTFLTLIPKKQGATQFKEFRPIASVTLFTKY